MRTCMRAVRKLYGDGSWKAGASDCWRLLASPSEHSRGRRQRGSQPHGPRSLRLRVLHLSGPVLCAKAIAAAAGDRGVARWWVSNGRPRGNVPEWAMWKSNLHVTQTSSEEDCVPHARTPGHTAKPKSLEQMGQCRAANRAVAAALSHPAGLRPLAGGSLGWVPGATSPHLADDGLRWAGWATGATSPRLAEDKPGWASWAARETSARFAEDSIRWAGWAAEQPRDESPETTLAERAEQPGLSCHDSLKTAMAGQSGPPGLRISPGLAENGLGWAGWAAGAPSPCHAVGWARWVAGATSPCLAEPGLRWAGWASDATSLRLAEGRSGCLGCATKLPRHVSAKAASAGRAGALECLRQASPTSTLLGETGHRGDAIA